MRGKKDARSRSSTKGLHASQKAAFAHHNAVLGGVFSRVGSLSSMLNFARAKIWSHLDSVMDIAGVRVAETRRVRFTTLHVLLCRHAYHLLAHI